MSLRIRVGVVPYLNARPLIEGFRSFEERVEFVFVAPSRLSLMMASGELDIALVSTVDYLRGDTEILPGVGIISRGAVNSVLLTGDAPVEQARTVNLDPSSLTSCALVALWYKLRIGRTPIFHRHPPDSPEAATCDARLVIGDRALKETGKGPYQVDMGTAWEEWMHSPFVYAVWLVRNGVSLGPLASFLRSAPARSHGLLLSLAEEASANLGIAQGICVRYLTDSLQFQLDETALEGMERFLNLAVEHHDWLHRTIDGFPPLGISKPVRPVFYQTESETHLSTGS